VTPAEELIAAADRLDGLMADLTPTPWQVLFECPEGDHHHDWDEVWIGGPNRETVAGLNERYTSGPRDAAYIAAMNPLVGKALADLMRIRADQLRYDRRVEGSSTLTAKFQDLARLINGDAS
jgi:hypothetical protein